MKTLQSHIWLDSPFFNTKKEAMHWLMNSVSFKSYMLFSEGEGYRIRYTI